MKTEFLDKCTFLFGCLFVLCFLFTGCDKDDDMPADPPIVIDVDTMIDVDTTVMRRSVDNFIGAYIGETMNVIREHTYVWDSLTNTYDYKEVRDTTFSSPDTFHISSTIGSDTFYLQSEEFKFYYLGDPLVWPHNYSVFETSDSYEYYGEEETYSIQIRVYTSNEIVIDYSKYNLYINHPSEFKQLVFNGIKSE